MPPTSDLRRTYEGADRPHLGSRSVEAIERLNTLGIRVEPPGIALLLILADKVDSSHGQWFGSLSKLAESLPLERHWFGKWLRRLEGHGLVQNLGLLEGRKLDTWQLLPDIYPALVEPTTTTSVEPIGATSNAGTDHDHPLVEVPGAFLVEPFINGVVASLPTTNTTTPSEQRSEHRGFMKPRRRTNTHKALDAEAIEAERKRQLEALRSLSV